MGAEALPCLRGRREQQKGNATRTEHRDRERLPGALLERTTRWACLAECCPLCEVRTILAERCLMGAADMVNFWKPCAVCAENWRPRPKVCRFVFSSSLTFLVLESVTAHIRNNYAGQMPREGMPRGSSRRYPRGDPSGILPELLEGHQACAGAGGIRDPKAT